MPSTPSPFETAVQRTRADINGNANANANPTAQPHPHAQAQTGAGLRSVVDARHPTVVVGGGAAGLELVSRLTRSAGPVGSGMASVVLVDRALTHLWKPRLHEVAAAVRDTSSAEHSFLSHASQLGYRFELGPLESIDLQSRRVQIGPVLGSDHRTVLERRWIDFSRLVLALGSEENDFGTPGAREHCLFLNTPEQAKAIRSQFLASLLRTARSLQDQVSIAVIGGGATGVELMAELHRSVESLRGIEPGISAAKVRFTLVEASDRLLNGNPDELSEYASDFLESLGTRFMLNSRVRQVDANGLHFANGAFLPADLKIWTAGVRGPGALANVAGLPMAPSGRVKVDEWLQCEGVPGVYALGDCAEWTNPRTGRPAPYTAQVASAQARYLATTLDPRHPSQKLCPFDFESSGTVVSLGDVRAVGTLTTRFGQRSKDRHLPSAEKTGLSMDFWRHVAALTQGEISCLPTLKQPVAASRDIGLQLRRWCWRRPLPWQAATGPI